MKGYLLLIAIVYVLIQGFKYFLEYVNLRHVQGRGDRVPPEFANVIDKAMLGKMRVYLTEKTRFDIICSACSSCVIILFFFGGFLDAYNSWIVRLGLSFVVSGWLFFLLLYLGAELLSAPFTLYFIFRIENRYGFNTMTFRLWLADFVKGIIVSIVLLSILCLAGLWLVTWSAEGWWLLIWCFFLAFMVFMTYVSPYVIEPLFNKFTPLEDDELRERVIRLASKVRIKISRVLKMDASKRSTHTNAYFTGLGKTKRIILFDTLLRGMDSDEIVSVLAHEIGHWKKRHLIKGLAVTQTAALILLFCAHRVTGGALLPEIFGVRAETFWAKATIVVFLFSMVSFFLKPALNGFSRMLEREADRIACDLTGTGETMVRVLAKLSKDNLSNPFPHSLYALFNYSHPPVLERIDYIRAYCRKKEG